MGTTRGAENGAPGGGTSAVPGRRGGWRITEGVLIALGLVLLIGGFAVLALRYRPYGVPTDSMEPTVHAGDRVVAARSSGSAVHRGDVVVFRDAVWGDQPMVKRVVGTGGDHVACCDLRGRLTVDGHSLRETYLAPDPLGRGADRTRAAARKFAVTVPRGRLFLLGDNRLTSADSLARLDDSAHGTVPRGAVRARVEAVAWPLGRTGRLPAGRAVFSAAGLPAHGDGRGPLLPAALACLVGAVLLVAVPAVAPVGRASRRLRPPSRDERGAARTGPPAPGRASAPRGAQPAAEAHRRQNADHDQADG